MKKKIIHGLAGVFLISMRQILLSFKVLVTHGLWRMCRDITPGATVDHKCSGEYANDAPNLYQVVRSFMTLSVFICTAGFALAIYQMINMPTLVEIRRRAVPYAGVSLHVAGLLYFLGTLCALVGSLSYSIHTYYDEALYFPEQLPPTWGTGWAEVLANLNSFTSDTVDVTGIEMHYGYSFGMAWSGVVVGWVASMITFHTSAPGYMEGPLCYYYTTTT